LERKHQRVVSSGHGPPLRQLARRSRDLGDPGAEEEEEWEMAPKQSKANFSSNATMQGQQTTRAAERRCEKARNAPEEKHTFRLSTQ
jgi:hypothetical protein